MGKGFEWTFFQRIHTNVQQVYEKMHKKSHWKIGRIYEYNNRERLYQNSSLPQTQPAKRKKKAMSLFWATTWKIKSLTTANPQSNFYLEQRLCRALTYTHIFTLLWTFATKQSLSLCTLISGTPLVVHWVRLHAPNAGGPSSIPGRGTRSHMHAATKKPTCCN